MALYSFTGQGQADPTQAAGMAQYNQQSGSVDPGMNLANQGGTPSGMGNALAAIIKQQQQTQQMQQPQAPVYQQAGYNALAQGAQNGSVGPTNQNAMLQQQMYQNGMGVTQPGSFGGSNNFFGGTNG